jgi:Flp pilus assembly pilin Flp
MLTQNGRRRSQAGQALVEYALILVLVAVAIVGGLRLMQQRVGNSYSKSANKIATVATNISTNPGGGGGGGGGGDDEDEHGGGGGGGDNSFFCRFFRICH